MEPAPRHSVGGRGRSHESAVYVESCTHVVRGGQGTRRVLSLAAVVERQRHHRRRSRATDGRADQCQAYENQDGCHPAAPWTASPLAAALPWSDPTVQRATGMGHSPNGRSASMTRVTFRPATTTNQAWAATPIGLDALFGRPRRVEAGGPRRLFSSASGTPTSRRDRPPTAGGRAYAPYAGTGHGRRRPCPTRSVPVCAVPSRIVRFSRRFAEGVCHTVPLRPRRLCVVR
jgi:hypothetical protein